MVGGGAEKHMIESDNNVEKLTITKATNLDNQQL